MRLHPVFRYDRKILQVYNAGLAGRPFQAGNVAWEPSPADAASGINPAVGLSWSGPEDFNNLPVYDLYFGTDPQDWDEIPKVNVLV